jgi:hypothetical protein
MWPGKKNLPFIFLTLAVVALPFSLLICHVALILFVISALVLRNASLEANTLWNSSFLMLVVLLSIFVAGMFYTDNIDNGGAQLLKKIFLFLIPLSLAIFVHIERTEVHFLLGAFVISCFIASLACIVNAFHQLWLFSSGIITLADFNYLETTLYKTLNPQVSDAWMLLSYRSLASGIDMHPTYLSLYFAFTIVVIIHFLNNKNLSSRWRYLGVGLVVYFSLFILFLGSRMMIITLMALLMFMIWEGKVIHGLGKKMISALFIMTIAGVIIYINPITRYRCYQEFYVSSIQIKPDRVYSNSTEIRASLWWTALKAMQNVNLIWGSGTGNSQDVMRKTSETYQVKNILGSDNPHNQFLCTVLQHGVVGVLVLTALLFMPMISAWSKKEYLIFGFCMLIVLSCLTETILERQKGIDFFAIFYPLLLFSYRTPSSANVKSRPLWKKRFLTKVS